MIELWPCISQSCCSWLLANFFARHWLTCLSFCSFFFCHYSTQAAVVEEVIGQRGMRPGYGKWMHGRSELWIQITREFLNWNATRIGRMDHWKRIYLSVKLKWTNQDESPEELREYPRDAGAIFFISSSAQVDQPYIVRILLVLLAWVTIKCDQVPASWAHW